MQIKKPKIKNLNALTKVCSEHLLKEMLLLHITYLSSKQVHALVGVNATFLCLRGASVLRTLGISGSHV